jgi:[protein-PII] uridylyltransferase
LVLDEMGLDVMSARVLTTTDGWSYDLFQLMNQQGDVLNEEDAAELVRRLAAATKGRKPRGPVRRTVPRRLRHFSTNPKIRFARDPDGGGSVLHIHCSDRPGLLSRIATAIFQMGVQVHNARIATFGERVEDTFLISDANRQPLTAEVREKLTEAISKNIEEG